MLHRLGDLPIDPSDRTPQVILPCDDCGQQFDAYGQVITDRFLNQRSAHWCPECRNARVRAYDLEREQVHLKRIAFQRQMWVQDAERGLPAIFWEASFDNFDPVGNEVRVQSLREYAETFPIGGRPKGVKSLLITRDVNGVGKTHLACAILHRIIERAVDVDRERCPYQFWPVGRVKQRFRAAQRYGGTETEEQVYRDFGSIWLLVLDDMGKEQATGADAAATYEMYYSLINERYNAGLPMIVTSNLAMTPWERGGICLDDLIGKGGASRLAGMTGGVEYVIAGEDRR